MEFVHLISEFFKNPTRNQALEWCFLILCVVALILYCLTAASFFRKKWGQSSNIRKLWRAALVIAAGTFVFFGSEFKCNKGDFRIFFDSIYRSARLLLLDGTLDFDKVKPNFTEAWMANAYSAAYFVVCGVAAVTAVYTVFSLFKNVVDRWNLFNKIMTKDVCIFNELNERSLATAKSLMDNPWPKRQRVTSLKDVLSGKHTSVSDPDEIYDFFTVKPENTPVIAFCDVYRQNNEISSELIAKAEELNAICLKMSIVDLHLLMRKKKAYKNSKKHIFRYYLFGVNENENMHHAVAIADIEKNAHTENKPLFTNLGIFVIALDHAKGVMIDSLNYELSQLYRKPTVTEQQGEKAEDTCENVDTQESRNGAAGLFVRRLNPALMMAQHIVFDPNHQLVGGVDDPENKADVDKDLKVVVLGAGSYGLELIKCLCWFYQRKKGGIEVHVFDKADNIEDLLKAKIEKLIGHKNHRLPDQDARLNVKVYGGIDALSHSFALKLEKELSNPDAVFVCLGDDNLNVEVAMRVRTLLDRIHYKKVYDAYECENGNEYVKITKHDKDIELEDKIKIFAVIHKKENDLSSDVGGWNRFSSGNFNIRCVGMDTEVYSEKEIYDFNFERAALKRHREHNSSKSLAYAINSYISCESDRVSSKSSEAHKYFVLGLYGKEYSGSLEQAKTESKRWNAYMLCRGTIVVDEDMNKARHKEIYEKRKGSVEWRFDRGMWHNGISAFDDKTKKEQDNNRYVKDGKE